MIYKTYVTAEGKYLGMYEVGTQPEDAIGVDINPEDGRQAWNGTAWYWPYEIGLAEALDRLNRGFNDAMQSLQMGWPMYEVLTWDKQSTEANAWLAAPADSKPATPFLSSLLEKCQALGAEDTLESLVGRVHANDLQYTEAVTSIIAVRHVAEDKINAAEDPMTVTWQFPS